jgi:hypothetical protein
MELKAKYGIGLDIPPHRGPVRAVPTFADPAPPTRAPLAAGPPVLLEFGGMSDGPKYADRSAAAGGTAAGGAAAGGADGSGPTRGKVTSAERPKSVKFQNPYNVYSGMRQIGARIPTYTEHAYTVRILCMRARVPVCSCWRACRAPVSVVVCPLLTSTHNTRTRTHAHARTHAQTHACTHTRTRTHTHTRARTRTRTCTHKYTHTCTHAHTRAVPLRD